MNGQVLGLSELGQALKEAREAKGMTLDDVQDLTKIQKRYLAAIEAGEYDKLPGNFYTRAFMKSYAEAVGLDPRELFAEYSRDLPRLENEVEVAPSRSNTQGVNTKESKIASALPKILIVAVLIIILIGIWVFMQKMTSGENDKARSQDNNSVVIKNGSDIGNGKVAKKEAKPDDNTPSEDKKQDNNPSADGNSKENSQQLNLENTSGQVSHFTLTGTDRFDVEITAKQGTNSWIQVSKNDPNGERFFYSMVSNGVNGAQDSGFHQDLSAVDTLYIKVGSAPDTVIKVNGQVLEFPNNGTIQQIYINFKKSDSQS